MTVKGPAIPEESFRVEGHCCAIRLPGLMTPESSIDFTLSEAQRRQLEAEGLLPPQENDQGEPSADKSA